VIPQRATEAIESSDFDELLRVIDGLCAAADWDALLELRVRCREAVTRGKQLWGVEEHIRYRIALEAPARLAGPAVTEGPARFAPGPLAEVAASTKTWAEMEPYLSPGPERSTFAAERVVRGDRPDVILDLPAGLCDWEPEYLVATYKSDRVEAPSPAQPPLMPADLPSPAPLVDDVDSEDALFDLVRPWVEESNGRCQMASVEGSALQAIGALGIRRMRTATVAAPTAISWLAWAGASGGAHGRRRGAAAGRFGVWWALAAIGDLPWPPDPDATGRLVERLDWAIFDDGAPDTGWPLRVAIADPDTGLAWAISALDAPD
jgi:hypothetical protein